MKLEVPQMSVRHKDSQCREKMATVAFRKWNPAVCKKDELHKHTWFSDSMHLQRQFHVKGGVQYYQRCTQQWPRTGLNWSFIPTACVCDVCPKGRLYLHVWTPLSLSHRPDGAKLLSSPSVLLVESCRSGKGSIPPGRTNPETRSPPNECVCSDKIYVPNKVIFYCSVYVQAGKRWTLYIRITASNEVIKTWLRVRLWFCVRPPCMLWWLLDELLPVWCIQ